MRLCRFVHQDRPQVGIYSEKFITSLAGAAEAYAQATGDKVTLPAGDSLIDLLAPGSEGLAAAKKVTEWVASHSDMVPAEVRVATDGVQLLVPIPRPNKLILLAGNYNEHITEGGGKATARAETFPYLFMKPPSTTLVDPGQPVVIPKVSPGSIDWELELGVVIGRKARHVPEADALKYVAGYTVVNDISDRKFRPNPGRKQRDKDSFFDWQHGKWHDSFCPCGPCITSADAIPDPQKLGMKLSVGTSLKQNATTGQQIFPVAAVVEFISHICTLEPGDIIATGTPAGVGNATGTYLKPGDKMEAWIEGIGTLVSPLVAEA
ncbi:MAG: fumarylacetoacetate hydrolase family protein [Pirellulaceae bacterium]|nr:fumarylacetoacetate hydrolase family protein [Pirellulaceae bacterium]